MINTVTQDGRELRSSLRPQTGEHRDVVSQSLVAPRGLTVPLQACVTDTQDEKRENWEDSVGSGLQGQPHPAPQLLRSCCERLLLQKWLIGLACR